MTIREYLLSTLNLDAAFATDALSRTVLSCPVNTMCGRVIRKVIDRTINFSSCLIDVLDDDALQTVWRLAARQCEILYHGCKGDHP